MSYQPLPHGTPESVGISSAMLLDTIRKMENCGTEMHGIMIYRHGKVIAEGWWSPFTRETVHINHSFGKTYVGSAVGAAVQKGILSVEDRVADIFADDLKALGIPDEGNLAELRVKHVLTMSNGMDVHPDGGADIVRNYLTTPIVHKPGSTFMYNTTGSSMLGEIVRRVSGQSLYDFMKENVLDPAGFDTEHLRWMSYANGLHAAPGTASCTENNLRLGILYLSGGEWNGRQLLNREWVEQATTAQIAAGDSAYGYQLWMNSIPDTFRFMGGHGQDCLVSKRNGVVVAIHQAGSEPHDVGAVQELVNQCLFSADLPDSLPEDPAAAEALRAYLGSREILQPGAQPYRAFDKGWEGEYDIIEGGFHFNTELLPFGDANVNREFYTHPDAAVKTLRIERCEEGFAFTVNDDARFIVRLDGRWVPHHLQSEMPNFDQSCATAVVEENEMIVNQWFFQTCFKTRLWLKRDGDRVQVKVRKERLHDDWPYIWREAVMQKRS